MPAQDDLAIVKKYWNTAPVDVAAITRELGLELNFVSMPSNISGRIRRIEGGTGYAIDVNQGHSQTRQRFTIAHELGHYIYHRDLLGRGTGDTLAFRAEGTDFPNPNITPIQERQANTFAANLLMPKHLIEKLRDGGARTPEALATALVVSVEAMKIRLGIKPDYHQEAGEDDVEVSRATLRRL